MNWLIVSPWSTVVISNKRGSLEKENPESRGFSKTRIECSFAIGQRQLAFKVFVLSEIACHAQIEACVLCNFQMKFKILYLSAMPQVADSCRAFLVVLIRLGSKQSSLCCSIRGPKTGSLLVSLRSWASNRSKIEHWCSNQSFGAISFMNIDMPPVNAFEENFPIFFLRRWQGACKSGHNRWKLPTFDKAGCCRSPTTNGTRTKQRGWWDERGQFWKDELDSEMGDY